MSLPTTEGLPLGGMRGHLGTEGRSRRRSTATSGRASRRWWLLLLLAALSWSLWDAGVGRDAVLNPGGWTVARRFLDGAAEPDLSGPYLAQVLTATLVTLAYATLGTALSVLLGLLGGLAVSRTWWRGRGWRPRGGSAGWLTVRAGLALPRGIHEAVWGLLLVIVLGPDPLTGVLAIAIPYGAITAKVYADLLDEAPRAPYTALLGAGGSRLAGCVYGLLPHTAADMLSYALYRFDCAIRSAVILGIVGAGGLGLLLDSAFRDLSYDRMWTSIYALLLVCGLGDLLSRRLRRRVAARSSRGDRALVFAAVLGGGAVVASWAYLGVDIASLWSQRARTEASYVAGAAWPPQLPAGGALALVEASVQTLQMSVVAMVTAGVAAIVLAPVAARARGEPVGPVQRILGGVFRSVLLLARAVPPPVWALLLLFVMHPGLLPGALALAAYNLGVLGRLGAEVVEDLDPTPARAVRSHGAGRAAVFGYAVLPLAAPRFLAYALYRWEVAVRETVIVGLVGAGGLGYLLARQLAAFDWRGGAATIAALVLLTFLVDLVSSAVRQALR